MVRITEQLIRKKSEHNEGIIESLEELSLHQEDIEKIEHINNWCKNIQILYLQANIIPKIENLNKLKNLSYLNLALNNIEKIENLERCESLDKIDLTLNFIGDLKSVCSLQRNIHLRQLNLTGNPCCDYEGYREYVIAKLPQLDSLDGNDITRSEKIKAQQNLQFIEPKINAAQEKYNEFRAEQIRRLAANDTSHLSNEDFWKSTSENAPETRVDIAYRGRKSREADKTEEIIKKPVRLFNKDGRPLNINQAKLPFTFDDGDPKEYVLDIAVYKYMDTSLIDVDLQPIYAKITIKGKIFQIVFADEVFVDRSTCQRSTITGHLVIKMPRVNYKPRIIFPKFENSQTKDVCPEHDEEKPTKNEYLEVKEQDDSLDFSKIIENNRNAVVSFIDNTEVPPLEYG